MKSFEDYKKELLQNPVLKKEWDSLDTEFDTIRKTLSTNSSIEECCLSPKVCNRILKNATYVNGKVVISKDDEWTKETEWDDLYEELVKEKGLR